MEALRLVRKPQFFTPLRGISRTQVPPHRLPAPATFLPRKATEDITLRVAHPKPATIVISKGTTFIYDVVGICEPDILSQGITVADIDVCFLQGRNPSTFPDPESYKPERWIGVADQDLPMFGLGPRSCLGTLIYLVFFLE